MQSEKIGWQTTTKQIEDEYGISCVAISDRGVLTLGHGSYVNDEWVGGHLTHVTLDELLKEF